MTRKRRHMAWAKIVTSVLSLAFLPNTFAAAYLHPSLASDISNGEPVPESQADNITHPEGYTGSGGQVMVNVCVTPDSADQQNMLIPTQNAIRTWNALEPNTGNYQGNGSGVSGFDFESVLLHELGHCVGLDHVNLASESGVSSANRDYSRSTNGVNDSFDLNPGVDGVRGSADDIRGDDVNLNWFRKSNNDPFTVAEIVDSSTYSISLADLPAGDSYVANADRDVATLLGYPNSEAVMQQGTPGGEAQRLLGHDDVAGIRLAMSGVDEIQGTTDDYTLKLNYLGVSGSNDCDINIKIDPQESSFAFCSVGFLNIAAGHRRLFLTSITMGGNVNWFFNQVSNAPDTDNDLILDSIENATCTDVADADTDDDGISDGAEDANQNGVLDSGETDPCNPDTDGDLIQDGTESGVTVGLTDTNANIFVPDADPGSTTSPLLGDTDGDTYSDGEEDVNFDGKIDPGESDPNDIASVPLQTTVVPWWPLGSQLLSVLLVIGLIIRWGFGKPSDRRHS